jgi:TPP-dependent pyruvate/acetoin dehydrogenase alpha subunit
MCVKECRPVLIEAMTYRYENNKKFSPEYA